MARDRQQKSYRFVVVYRCEPREIPGAAGEWRGWVARVPDPRERETQGSEETRRGFLELEELPGAIRKLMGDQAEAPQPRAAAKERIDDAH
ncbi:MAG: hypothetical protein IIC03_11805 [Proteobacteria bacterium]|nr:hypothetical protein [Pseudomonadota bacterium]